MLLVCLRSSAGVIASTSSPAFSAYDARLGAEAGSSAGALTPLRGGGVVLRLSISTRVIAAEESHPGARTDFNLPGYRLPAEPLSVGASVGASVDSGSSSAALRTFRRVGTPVSS